MKARSIVATISLCLLTLAGAPAGAVPGAALTIAGPATFIPGAQTVFSGRLTAGGVGLPAQQIALHVDGSRAGTVATAQDGRWSATTALAYPPASHVVHAVHLTEVGPLATRSADHAIEVERRPLSVSPAGAGAGSVAGPGIACGSDCTEDVPFGESVTLTATPASGSTFIGWSGDCSGAAPTCTVRMTAGRSVVAAFDLLSRIEFEIVSSAGPEHTSDGIAVRRSGGIAGTSSVEYSFVPVTAFPPSDFDGTGGVITFEPGQTRAMIAVSIVPDTLDEPEETFRVQLMRPVNAVLGDLTVHARTIVDDDPVPSVGFAVSASSSVESTTSVSLTVVLSAPSARMVTVNYATANGTAVAPGDYTAASSGVIFAPGTTVATITLSVVNDAVAEPDETFRVQLSSAVNATLGAPSHTRTIVNDD